MFLFSETTVRAIEDAFKEFTAKEDIAIILISQYVSSFSDLGVQSVVYNHAAGRLLWKELTITSITGCKHDKVSS